MDHIAIDVHKRESQMSAFRHMGHVALEVSYSVHPAVLETLDLLAEVVKPALDRGWRI